jgi:hypothetical protein
MCAIHCTSHLAISAPLWHHGLIKGHGNVWAECLLNLY